MKQLRRSDRQPTRWLRIGIPVVLVLVWLIGGSVGGPYFGKVDEVATNDQSSFLPESADATQVSEQLPDFLGSDTIPAVVVVTGAGGPAWLLGVNSPGTMTAMTTPMTMTSAAAPMTKPRLRLLLEGAAAEER